MVAKLLKKINPLLFPLKNFAISVHSLRASLRHTRNRVKTPFFAVCASTTVDTCQF